MDTSILISLLLGVFATGVVAFYIIPKQIAEVARPRNQFTRLRWILLFLFIFSVITAVPALVYLVSLLNHSPSDLFASVARVTGNISRVTNTILLLMVYNYRYEDSSD
jgi:hypothetical protein